jgi:hypothetical protein
MGRSKESCLSREDGFTRNASSCGSDVDVGMWRIWVRRGCGACACLHPMICLRLGCQFAP